MNDQKWLNIIKKVIHQGYERAKVVEHHQKNSQTRENLRVLRYYKETQENKLSSPWIVRT
jgi:hypothetical protein